MGSVYGSFSDYLYAASLTCGEIEMSPLHRPLREDITMGTIIALLNETNQSFVIKMASLGV